MQSCRVYVVSDVRLYREGLTGSLAGHSRLAVIGASIASEAVIQIADLIPDVILLDLAAKDSLALPRAALAVAPQLRVVAFAVAEVAADVLACAEAGICGYVAKDGSAADVVDAVLRAVSGELVCSPQITAFLFQRVAALATERRIVAPTHALTRRELEIAELVAQGLPNKLIARDLHLGVPTIKNHVHSILQKLKLQRRGEVGGRRLDPAFQPHRSADETVRRGRTP